MNKRTYVNYQTFITAENLNEIQDAIIALEGDVTEIEASVDTKADVDGTYPDLTSGSAEQLLSTEYTADSVPYKFRANPTSADRCEEEIVGGTIAWNQLASQNSQQHLNFEGCDTVYDGTTQTVTITNISRSSNYISGSSRSIAFLTYSSVQKGHVYLFATSPTVAGITTVHLASNASNPQVFKVTEDSYTSIYLRMTNQFDFVNYCPIGSSISFKVNLFDLTQMFGTTIADYIYSLNQATAGAGVAFFRSLFPNSYYAYNAGELISVSGLSAHVMRDANDNIIASYPLDSSLTLRGIPKIADGKMYFDGDIYASDGTVTRKYGTRAYQSGDESLADAITDGTNTVYKLTTPTTESANPYQQIQNTGSTEEYVSTTVTPVGHNTKYYDNLRKKIEGLPWDLSMLAPIENGTTSSRAYAVGAYFMHNNQFCKAKTAIASGATFTLNTNYTVTTVGAELYSALH